jgi:hypothetical protein
MHRLIFLFKTGRRIMSKNTVIVLIHHRHKLLDLTYKQTAQKQILRIRSRDTA